MTRTPPDRPAETEPPTLRRAARSALPRETAGRAAPVPPPVTGAAPTIPAPGGRRRAAGAPGAGSNPIAAAMSEGELEEQVQALCTDLGILRFHNPDSRRMERGLPDDILIGPRGVLWRELKNMRRKLTPEQEKVGEQLTAHGQDWAVWRPCDLLSQRIRHELMAISAVRVATA